MFKDLLIAIQNRENLDLGAVVVTLDETCNTSVVKVDGKTVALVNPLNLKVTLKNNSSALAQDVINTLVADRTPKTLVKAQALTTWLTFS